MRPVQNVIGRAYPLGQDNVDTDVILPGQFLKTITRTGLGSVAFRSIRTESGNLFDDPRWKYAPIIIAGSNFGCGSSREHAVWAMMDLGIEAVIASSFSDIFAGNAFKNGLLAITLPIETVTMILARANAGQTINIDLARQSIKLEYGEAISFEMDPFRKTCLLSGLDEIAMTLDHDAEIAAFETGREAAFPWLSVAR